MRAFCSDLTATQAAQMLGMNRNTINRYYLAFRRAIFAYQGAQMAAFSCRLEVDESYFGLTALRWRSCLIMCGLVAQKPWMLRAMEESHRLL